MSVSYKTICRYLDKETMLQKVRKTFFLSSEQMQKRVEFCRNMLNRGIGYNQIMFTDETKINLGCYTNDSIRLSKETKEKLKKGNADVYELINRPQKKFEKSLMFAGGICFYGLSKLIVLDGTLNNFSYGQALLFYKEDVEQIKSENGVDLIFEQDGAKAHTCKANITLLKKLFKNSGWIQNPPNSPDLASPIERLWGYIKPRVKRRNPETLEDLKNFFLEEWNSVPSSIFHNLCSGYINRLKKWIELEGRRIEPEHFPKSEIDADIWEKPKVLPNLRVIYNDKQLKNHQIKEIKALKKEIKSIKSLYTEKHKKSVETKGQFKKKDLKNMSMGRALSIINGPEKIEKEKEEKINAIKEKITMIEDMSLKEYVDHRNYAYDERNNVYDEDSTIDEIEEKINEIIEISKKNKNIKYKIYFQIIIVNCQTINVYLK